tara:strand:+ start:70 stop:756 length:687 start_codon:yes stop_codon:yes gene_type:complete
MLNKYGFIIQARMGSKRLPGKSLKKINNTPILSWIINSLKRKKKFKKFKIIVATTNLKIDDIIAKVSIKHEVNVYRGSHHNVLERYYLCAKKFALNNIIRLTSDNPFVDTFFLEKMINEHEKNKNDYTSSKDSLPIGLGAEMMTHLALQKAYNFSKSDKEKEHVCDYILNNPQKFKIQNLVFKSNSKKIKNLRLTIDTKEDLIFNRRFCNSKTKIKIRELIKYDSSSN